MGGEGLHPLFILLYIHLNLLIIETSNTFLPKNVLDLLEITCNAISEERLTLVIESCANAVNVSCQSTIGIVAKNTGSRDA